MLFRALVFVIATLAAALPVVASEHSKRDARAGAALYIGVAYTCEATVGHEAVHQAAVDSRVSLLTAGFEAAEAQRIITDLQGRLKEESGQKLTPEMCRTFFQHVAAGQQSFLAKLAAER